MNIKNTNDEIVKQLRLHNISTKMRSLESSDWIVYETIDNEIVGAVGISGLFHSSSIQIHEKFRNRGFGVKIQKKLVDEAKNRNFSFVTVFVDPRNISSQKMHEKVGYETIFRIHYSKDIIQDFKIIVLKKRGRLIKNFLNIFNSKIGIFLLGIILKIFKKYFKEIIGYNEKEVPDPSIKHMIQNFEKI